MHANRNRTRRRLIAFHAVTEAGAAPPPPSGTSGSVAVPPILTDEIAIAEWERVAPALARNGELTALQQTLLVGYCTTLAKAKRAEDTIAREGAYYATTATSGATVLKRHPAAVDAEKSWSALRQFARQLGIGSERPTPVAKSEPRRAVFK